MIFQVEKSNQKWDEEGEFTICWEDLGAMEVTLDLKEARAYLKYYNEESYFIIQHLFLIRIDNNYMYLSGLHSFDPSKKNGQWDLWQIRLTPWKGKV